MASIRKRYRDQGFELEERDEDNAVHNLHQDAEAIKRERDEIRARAQERVAQERGDDVDDDDDGPDTPESAPPPQPSPPSIEQIISAAPLPEVAKNWLRTHPEYVSSREHSQRINGLHERATQLAGGEQFTQRYLDRMEELLGMRAPQMETAPKPNGQIPPPRPQAPQSQQRPSNFQPPQQPQQRFQSPPPSAPPRREAPSMTSGRPMAPQQLT